MPYQDIVVGETITIDVLADGVTDQSFLELPDEVVFFGFDFDYDAFAFSYVNATAGFDFKLLDSISSPSADVSGLASSIPGPTGDNILLAKLSFTALLSGIFEIAIDSDLNDPNQGLSTLVWGDDSFLGGEDNRIDISANIALDVSPAIVPIPEPATIALVSTGLVGLTADVPV